jgi:hypothetical protein
MKPIRLRRGEYCRLHQSRTCCGRESRTRSKQPIKKREFINGVEIIRDPHHPRGYREKRTPEQMRRLVLQKIDEQHGCCAICQEPFTDSSEIVGEHKTPKGSGGSTRDDHPDNIQAAHNWPCNVKKGSRRIA